MPDTITLQNSHLLLEISATNGTIVRLRNKHTGWEALRRPHLGLSFELLIPLPDRRHNTVFGATLPLARWTLSQDGCSLSLHWRQVSGKVSGPLDVDVTATIALDAEMATFTLEIDNQSPYMVESAEYPLLGDITPPEGAPWLRAWQYVYNNARENEIWPHHENYYGYFGVDVPTQFKQSNPVTPFALYRTEDQGVYLGAHSAEAESVTWGTEQHPGSLSTMDCLVPPGDTISGHEIYTKVRAVHMPYVAPGERRTLPAIALGFYEGGWQKGADLYIAWRDGVWTDKPDLPAWAREPHAWQQLHINSPEDELRMRYADLPEIGRECAENGVKAIQLVGWNKGGQDRGNPCHDTDPRLGTREELKAAISAIQAMGVKVILFCKFTWADRSTEWFREELIDYAVKDPYGDYYMYEGYQYFTAPQLLNINTRRLVPMCFWSEAYMRICEAEFCKVLDLGPDGILYDETQWHGHTIACFDTSHGHRYGASVHGRDVAFLHRLKALAPEGFLFAGEALYDQLTYAYHLSYLRSGIPDHMPLSRYMRPDGAFMTAVCGFDDRDMINQCLMNRYIISYEPFNFKGGLGDIPLTVAYGRRMDALRTELRAYFWDGQYRDQCGAAVTRLPDGAAHTHYAIFLRQDDSVPGIVVSNYTAGPLRLAVRFDGGIAPARYRLVDDDTWHDADIIDLPPHSAAVALTR